MKQEKQGYISKTIEHNGVTIVTHRPDIDSEEREKRAAQIADSLGHSLRDYLARSK